MTRTGSLSPNLDEPRGKNNQDASFHFRHFSLVIMNSQLFSVGQQGCTGKNYHQFGMRSSCTRWDSTTTKQQVLLEYTIATRRANQFESDCWSNVENQLISIVGQWKGGRLSHKAKKLAFFIHTTSEKILASLVQISMYRHHASDKTWQPIKTSFYAFYSRSSLGILPFFLQFFLFGLHFVFFKKERTKLGRRHSFFFS